MTKPQQQDPHKVALVTGGSRGIGAATARRLATSGTDVAITYLNSRDAAEDVVAYCTEQGVRAEVFRADAASRDDMRTLVQRVVDAFGRLDILVNSAGIFDVKPIEETTDEEFARMMNINVRATYLTSREAAKIMPEGGRIINVGSNMAEAVKMEGATLYTLSKAAVAGFTRALARDLGPKGITVSCVQPGPTDTDMNPADPADNPTAASQTADTALGRYGRPEELAHTIAFLASPESAYVTGAIINVDGGSNA